MNPNPIAATPPPLSTMAMAIAQFENKYEINPQITQSLSKLALYDSVLILDDSGSMIARADPLFDQETTRWDELKKAANVIIEAHAVVGTFCDIYFINRGYCRGVSSYEQIAQLFINPPFGDTNLINILNLVTREHIGDDMEKPLIVHILTDGHPTNPEGQGDFPGLRKWLTDRSFPDKTFYSIVLCTSDADICRAYRTMENNPPYNTGVVGVDVSEDYRGETKAVKRQRGRNYRFTYGDYIVKTLLGTIDPSLHQIDLPEGCCSIN